MGQDKRIQPILLGSDFNVYGMARAFHEAYGVNSIALASAQLSPTKYSSIVDVRPQAGFNTPETFIKVMRDFIHNHQQDTDTAYILIACGDGYAELVSMFLDELSDFFICPYISHDLHQKLENKKDFYALCDTYDMPYPQTVFVAAEEAGQIDQLVEELPFDYPMVLKPNNSISYLQTKFEGKKKAYFIDTAMEMKQVLKRIYTSGYPDEMIIQDMIPGDDTHMRVLNVYVDQHHNVRMMSLGHAILEDPAPAGVGNYLAILPDENDEICRRIKHFLEDIHYTGFANFDMKYDSRDGQYKLFEINLRQGRSSFFVTLSGENMAAQVVNDYVKQVPFEATTYVKGDAVWLGAPKSLITRYVDDEALVNEVNRLYKAGNYGYTALYKADRSPLRWLQQTYSLYRYYSNFKKYFRKKTL
ncbi:carboxylate--amine ligase [Dolosigranulum pigrum]|uniref:carboxylate--amine ligase n=1 Tax=Dolosigranulum pigrum TaxID=29394 RepID=UPI001BB6B7B4|nr:carboxylate--amine ligase [Dolosigranulum pigrum]QTJ40764.1 carboxylate--amine ligase [Dolosigranulum pigrum]